MLRLLLVIAVGSAAVVTALSTSAFAQEEGKEKAKALLELGNQALQDGDAKTAVGHYEAAYAAFASPKILFNLAEAERELGRVVSAARHYEQMLAELEGEGRLQELAREQLQELSNRVARLQVDASPDSTEILVDGEAFARGQTLFVRPGLHDIEVTAPGFETVRRTVDAPVAERTVAQFALLPAVVPPPPPPDLVIVDPVDDGPAVYETWWFWTGVAVVAVGAGVAAFAVASGDDFVPAGELGQTSFTDWMQP